MFPANQNHFSIILGGVHDFFYHGSIVVFFIGGIDSYVDCLRQGRHSLNFAFGGINTSGARSINSDRCSMLSDGRVCSQNNERERVVLPIRGLKDCFRSRAFRRAE